VFYEPAPDVLARATPLFPAHLERLHQFHAGGSLLNRGTLGDPQEDGSVSIFTTEAAAEDFVGGDPFIHHSVMRSEPIRRWTDMNWA
jgi:uncharacterized protein